MLPPFIVFSAGEERGGGSVWVIIKERDSMNSIMIGLHTPCPFPLSEQEHTRQRAFIVPFASQTAMRQSELINQQSHFSFFLLHSALLCLSASNKVKKWSDKRSKKRHKPDHLQLIPPSLFSSFFFSSLFISRNSND